MRGKQIRFTEDEKIELRMKVQELLKVGMSQTKIASKLGVSESMVTKFKREVFEMQGMVTKQ